MFSNFSRCSFCLVPRFISILYILLQLVLIYDLVNLVNLVLRAQYKGEMHWLPTVTRKRRLLRSPSELHTRGSCGLCGLVSPDTNDSLDDGWFLLSHHFTIFHYGFFVNSYFISCILRSIAQHHTSIFGICADNHENQQTWWRSEPHNAMVSWCTNIGTSYVHTHTYTVSIC